MSSFNLTVRVATPADADAVAAFRIQQYKTAAEFEILDLEALAKQRGRVLIAEARGEIVSTMQIEVVESLEDFMALDLDITEEIGFNAFPTLYLSKGATARQYRNTGLNSLLRLEALRYGMQQGVRSLSGIAYDNAPRLHLLARLGYSITVIPHRDVTYSRPKGDMLFLSLPEHQFQAAMSMLEVEVTADASLTAAQ